MEFGILLYFNLKQDVAYYNFVTGSYFDTVVDRLSKFYLTKLKGFDWDKMCVMTLLFEGERDEVQMNEKKVFAIAKMYEGISAGESNGERGYMLTFVIAYIRVSTRYFLNNLFWFC